MDKHELNPWKLSTVLFIITAVSGLILAFVLQVTQPRIEANELKKEVASLKILMPQIDSFEKKGNYYLIQDTEKKPLGYVFLTQAKGYGGAVRCNIGVDTSGKITGIIITAHQETPGLGTKIQDVKKGDTEPYYLKQFKSLGQDKITADNIQTITGATISSKAVIACVRSAFEEFNKLNIKQ